MIAVDTSAIVAIMNDEPERSIFLDQIGHSSRACISAGSLLECGIVIGSKQGDHALEVLRRLCAQLSLEILPVDADQSRIGYNAFLRYGRGLGSKAKLNFGDCFAYALAKSRSLPLLFKGDDFIHTDIEPAWRPA